MALVSYFISILFVISRAIAQEGPIVETTYGSVQGVNINLENGTIIQSYMAIPYAMPPLGDLRFEVHFFSVLL